MTRMQKCGLAAAIALAAALSVLLMWSRGVFCIAKRGISPDGTIRTTAYSKSISEGYPTDGGFTIADKGRFIGSVTFENAVFEDFCWSPNSSYLLVSMQMEDGTDHMEMQDYVRNNSRNLNAYLEKAMAGNAAFADVPGAGGEYQIEFRFLSWQDDGESMRLSFAYTDTAGASHTGECTYGHPTKELGDCDLFDPGQLFDIVETAA